MITWTHIPADRSKCLPEQWQARAGMPERSVAVLRRAVTVPVVQEWQAVMQGPDDALASLIISGYAIDHVKSDIEETLRTMGWT